jgi:phage terminase small subunit
MAGARSFDRLVQLESEMLMRGRKPLPSNVIRLRGNPGKRRLNDAEPRPAARSPACPACLGDEARKEWQRLSKELAELGLLTGIDRGLLAAYCQAHALWVEAVSSLGRYGTWSAPLGPDRFRLLF